MMRARVCSLCKSREFNKIYKINNLPLFQNKVYNSAKQAKEVKRGDIELVECNDCGFVYNKAFNYRLMSYDKSYHGEQNYSPHFQNYLKDIIRLLLDGGFRGKKIVEIGCGKGFFLKLLKKNGFDVIGFDPAYEGKEKYIIQDYFSEKYSDISADLIILRHTLEHIFDPHNFLQIIARANKFRGKIFIEVPNFEWIVAKKAFWDVFYEHCNYFTEKTLKLMFKRSLIGKLFNGQYIFIIAGLRQMNHLTGKKSILKVKSLEKFIFKKEIDKYRKIIEKNKEIVVWGAGAKGATFVNIIDTNCNKIKFLIDINPKKQNKFIGGTGHKIFSPNSIDLANVPDTIIVMNENYLSEIKRTLNNKRLNLLVLST